MSAMRVRCPHCDGEIRVDLDLEAVGTTRHGPKPTNLSPEVETFIIDAIETYRSSFATVARLLEEKKILTPRGRKRWYPASVRREYDKIVAKRQREAA